MKKQLLLITLMLSGVFVSAQTGITWSAPMDIATNAYNNDHPRITLNSSGKPMVLWGNQNSNNALFSRWTGTSFSTPVMVNPISIPVFAATWAGPDIASKGDTVYVVFKQTPEDTNHIYIIHSFNGGISFSSPVRVDYVADSISRFPTITTDASGNPIVAFMKFNPGFTSSRWVVTRSADYGNTFTTDIKASGHSGSAGICDCCPGAVVISGNNILMLYRDNLNNLRNMWAGISSNGGATFPAGMDIDHSNWNVPACPATGPDGIIIGDSLYAVYASSASGNGRVYSSVSSISSAQGGTGTMMTGNFSGLQVQNYPRIDHYGNALAKVWIQTVNGTSQAGLYFTSNIHNGFQPLYDQVAVNSSASIINADVAVGNGEVHVVWQDDNSGTVKYRKGTFSVTTAIMNGTDFNSVSVYPNPASTDIHIYVFPDNNFQAEILDLTGERLIRANNQKSIDISHLAPGIYFIKLINEKGIVTTKFIKE